MDQFYSIFLFLLLLFACSTHSSSTKQSIVRGACCLVEVCCNILLVYSLRFSHSCSDMRCLILSHLGWSLFAYTHYTHTGANINFATNQIYFSLRRKFESINLHIPLTYARWLLYPASASSYQPPADSHQPPATQPKPRIPRVRENAKNLSANLFNRIY